MNDRSSAGRGKQRGHQGGGSHRTERRQGESGGRRGANYGRPNRPTRVSENHQRKLPVSELAPNRKPRNDADQAVEDTDLGRDVVAGRHPVLEALKAGRPINKLLVAEGAEGGSLAEVLARAREQQVVVQRVPKTRLDLIAGKGHQGVAVYVSPQPYAELDDVVSRETGQAPLVVVLDEIADPHNLGAIVRTAEAAGAQGVIIPKRRAVPLTTVVAKAAAGALEYVPVARVNNLVQTLQELKQRGYWVVGLDVAGKQTYTEVSYHGSIAVVIGAEGKGLARLVRETCDYLVQLPMLGNLQSLNASVAAGVMLYEVVRQRH